MTHFSEIHIDTLSGRKKQRKRQFAIMDHFGKLKKGKRETRKEVLTLSRYMSRSFKTTQRWARHSIKEHSPLGVEKTFEQYCSVKDKGNKYHLSGCGPSCSDEDRNLLCPTCRTFVWHEDCLIHYFELRKLPLPDFSLKKWKCIYCVLKYKRRKHV